MNDAGTLWFLDSGQASKVSTSIGPLVSSTSSMASQMLATFGSMSYRVSAPSFGVPSVAGGTRGQ